MSKTIATVLIAKRAASSQSGSAQLIEDIENSLVVDIG